MSTYEAYKDMIPHQGAGHHPRNLHGLKRLKKGAQRRYVHKGGSARKNEQKSLFGDDPEGHSLTRELLFIEELEREVADMEAHLDSLSEDERKEYLEVIEAYRKTIEQRYGRLTRSVARRNREQWEAYQEAVNHVLRRVRHLARLLNVLAGPFARFTMG